MKIVREKPFNFEFECRKCGSQLIATIDDVKVGYFGGGYGDDTPSRLYYVTCPVCDTDRTLKSTDVTPKVRAQADRTDKRRR